MQGTIFKRVAHVCIDEETKREMTRWVRMTQGVMPPCKHCGADVTKGKTHYDCSWWAGGRKRSKTFEKIRQAEKFLTSTVKQVQDGTYTQTRPTLMGKVFDGWKEHMEVKEKQG